MTKNERGAAWRRVLSWVLLILAAVLAPLSAVLVWTRNIVLDTDRYVETVAPLADSTAIQDAAVTRAVQVFEANVDIEGVLDEALEPPLDRLAPTVAAAVQSAVAAAAEQVVRSDAFADIWEQSNRIAHPQVKALLTGKDEGVVLVDEGAVIININGVLVAIRDGLAERIPPLAAVPVENFALNLTLVQSDELDQVQDGVRALDGVANILPLIAAGLFVASVLVHPRRRRATLRVGVALAVGMLVMLVGVRFGRSMYLDALPRDVSEAAAADVFDILTRFLREGLRALILVGVLIALVAAAFGPSRAAAGVRSAVRRHRWVATGAVVALGLVFLAVMESPSTAAFVVIGGLTVAMVIAVHLIAAAPDRAEETESEAVPVGAPAPVAPAEPGDSTGSSLPPPPPSS